MFSTLKYTSIKKTISRETYSSQLKLNNLMLTWCSKSCQYTILKCCIYFPFKIAFTKLKLKKPAFVSLVKNKDQIGKILNFLNDSYTLEFFTILILVYFVVKMTFFSKYHCNWEMIFK